MRISRDDRAGLYITIIVHLVILIILMGVEIGATLKKESSFVLDFTKLEQIEKLQKELDLKQAINDRLNEMLAGGYEPVRNIAVDRSMLKDDRHSAEDAEQLYKDAEKLADELRNGAKVEDDDDYVAVKKSEPVKKEEKNSTYSGPSVVSYDLSGRKASRLSIPAYRCLGSGHVTVIITVDPSGNVLNAKVQDDGSSVDQCLRNFAVRAARLSKFSASTSAPSRQMGNIVYMFIAQ
mgnify:CR=1 FL=1